jgi:zinc protease
MRRRQTKIWPARPDNKQMLVLIIKDTYYSGPMRSFLYSKVHDVFFAGLIVILFGVMFAPVQAAVLKLPHRLHRLPNGLTVVLVRYPSRGVIAYQIPVRVGSRNEVDQGKTGFAHFFEHLMFRGTKNMSAEEFRDTYNRHGCENNAWTSNDLTNYHGLVSKSYLPIILKAEADRFQNLHFEEKALKDEAGAVLGEYNKNAAQPDFLIEEALAETAFTKHTYGHTTMGYKADIEKYTERYKDVWPFFKRYYRPDNTSVILVGDIDFNSHLAMVKNYFGGWKSEKIDPVEIPTEPEQTAQREKTILVDVPTQSRVVVAYKTPSFDTENLNQAIVDIISEAYFSKTSDFQKEYRFNKKWLDDVTAYAVDSIDPGLWQLYLRFSEAGEGHIQEVGQAVDAQIKRLSESPLPDSQLSSVKKRLRNYATVSWFGSPEALAAKIAWYVSFERDLGVLDRIFDNIDKVTAEDILQYSKKYLLPRYRTIITLKGNSV